MAAKKAVRVKKFSEMVAIRVSGEVTRLLDELAERIPVATRQAIAREALHLGLRTLRENPVLLFQGAPQEHMVVAEDRVASRTKSRPKARRIAR